MLSINIPFPYEQVPVLWKENERNGNELKLRRIIKIIILKGAERNGTDRKGTERKGNSFQKKRP